MKNRAIYFLLTNTQTLFTRCIGYYTKAPYNHISISFDQELTNVYSFGRKSVFFPLYAGFVEEDIHGGIYSLRQETSCMVIKVKVTQAEWRSVRGAVQRFREIGDDYTYNLIGLIGFLLKREIKRSNAFFCSQFVATMLQDGNVGLLSTSPGLTAPHDFLLIEQKEVVFEGLLRHYPYARKKTQRLRRSS